MMKESLQILSGSMIWKWIKIKNKLDASKVILILTGENKALDFYALKYLDRAIERKTANGAVIFAYTEESFKQASSFKGFQHPVSIKRINDRQLRLIYKWYCMVKFDTNLFFTFTDRTRDNLLGKFIRETEIDERDTVCLAIYNFRTVYAESGVCI